MSKQRIMNYLKFSKTYNSYLWNQLIFNKSNSPRYDPKITQQFWPFINTVTKDHIIYLYDTLLYSNNRAIY